MPISKSRLSKKINTLYLFQENQWQVIKGAFDWRYSGIRMHGI